MVICNLITDFKSKSPTAPSTDSDFANELMYYMRFNVNSVNTDSQLAQGQYEDISSELKVSGTARDIHATLQWVNIRQAAGPDGIS